MSEKKSQRTKGNTKPSSSSRAAQFLQQDGLVGFIGFTGIAGNVLSQITDDSMLDGELKILARKMSKRDTITKLKAIQEFTTFCKEKNSNDINSVLIIWPRIFNKLSLDFDHRIREATQQAHYEVAARAGRNLGPYLKIVMPCWLITMFDPYIPTSLIAQKSFNETFPKEKKNDVLLFCRKDILQTLCNNILKETLDTLSDPKTTPLEEREAKYIRVVSSSLLAFDFFIKNIDSKLYEETIQLVTAEKNFWKYSKHSSGLIRSSFYTFILTCCKFSVMNECILKLATTLLTSFDEQESIVVQPLWDLVLIFISKFQGWWNHVNVRKAVFPKFWKMLKNCGYGNISIIYPNLILFVSQLPNEVVGEEYFFHKEFLTSLTEGLFTKINVLSPVDILLVITSYRECLQYMLLRNIMNPKVMDYLLKDQLLSMLRHFFNEKIFASSAHVFFMQLNCLTSLVKNKSSSDVTVKQLLIDIWLVISDAVIPQSKHFHSEGNHFFEMLVLFVQCMSKERNIITNKESIDVTHSEDHQTDHLINLVCNIYNFFDSSTEDYKYFIKILCLTFDIKLLKFILNTTIPKFQYVDNLDVCCKFHTFVLLPLSHDKFEDIAKLSVSIHQVLRQSEIMQYLDFIFKEKLPQEYSLHLWQQILDCSNHSVLSWSKSKFAQKNFMDLLMYNNILKHMDIFSKYLLLLMGEDLNHYVEQLMLKLKEFFHESYPELLPSFLSICKSSCDVSDVFIDLWLLIMQKKHATDVRHDALLFGFHKIASSSFQEEFRNIFLKWVIENCFDDVIFHDDVLIILSDTSCKSVDGFCLKLAEDLLAVNHWEKFEDRRRRNAVLFYSKFLEMICLKFPLNQDNIVDTAIKCMSEENYVLESFIFTYENNQKELLEKLISTRSAKELKYFLNIFQKRKKLVEPIDKCLMLITPSVENFADKLCVVIDFLDISEISRLAVQYISELLSGADVKVFNNLLKVVWCILSRWCLVDNSNKEDYKNYATDLLNYILVWCSDNNHLLLLSTALNDTVDVSLDKNLMVLLCHLLQTASICIRGEHWDFYLCSLVAWLQTCEETFILPILSKCSVEFMVSCYEMFRVVAAVFDKYTKASYPPLIGLSVSFDGVVDDSLLSEWKEFFLPACYAAITNVAMKALYKESLPEELSYAISSAMQFVSREYIIESYLFKNSEKLKKTALDNLFKSLNERIFNGQLHFKLQSFHILSKLSDLIEEYLCKNIEPDSSECEQLRSFPDELFDNITKSHDVVLTILSEAKVSITNPLRGVLDKQQLSHLLIYIISWQLIIEVFKMASPSNRSLFANFFHKFGILNELMTCLCCVIKSNCSCNKLDVSNLDFEDLQTIAVQLFFNAMSCMPALIRSWFSKLDRKDAAYVEKFTSSYITPDLLKREFNNIIHHKQDFSNNMNVKALPVAREIVAKYSIEEMTMELVLTLPINYPLSPVTVECGKRFGVSTAEWRQWMLQLTTFLSFQNGAVSDGLQMWKNNVNKRFEGVEECMVCFSIIHPSNYSLPTTACKTCKKSFHPVCLYKWFGTSGKSTCPLCRDQF